MVPIFRQEEGEPYFQFRCKYLTHFMQRLSLIVKTDYKFPFFLGKTNVSFRHTFACVSVQLQASDLLSGWFGDDDGREDLGEERLPLHEDTIEFLKGRKLAFLFVAGWEAGKEKLEKR